MYRWMFATLVVFTALFGMLSHSSAALASENRGSYICSGTNVILPAPSCMDLEGGVYAANQPIILVSSSTGQDLGWNTVPLGQVTATAPFTYQPFDTRYKGDSYYYIEKTTATGHNGCIGIATNSEYPQLTWQPCGADYTKWVISKDQYFINIRASDDDSNHDEWGAAPCNVNGQMVAVIAALSLPGCPPGPWDTI